MSGLPRTPVVAFLVADPSGRITLADGAVLGRVGGSARALAGASVRDLCPELRLQASRALAGESLDARVLCGGLVLDCSWRPMPDGSAIGIAIDATSRAHGNGDGLPFARHDPLTGLANRASIETQLHARLVWSRRVGRPLGVLCIDLDDFKLVNDSLGHDAGDRVLVEVVERILRATRRGDLLGRIGGDEFVLICEGAEAAAARVLGTFDELLSVDGVEFRLGASIGVALDPRTETCGAQELLKRAHGAMRAVKRADRNAYALYAPDRESRIAALTFATRLRRGIEAGELELHYQTIHDLGRGGVRGVEALVRWREPGGELIPPAAFIPQAEQSSLISLIGTWVIEAVSRQAAEWAQDGLRPLISFNASPRELRDRHYPERVAAALERHGVPPQQLMVEVTESAMHGDALEVLDALHDLGVLLAIDDFGAAHSSLSRLRELPLDVLKIDRSFLRETPGDRHAALVMRAIATLGRGLGMQVVVEGIETPEQERFVAGIGCRYGQGYHLGMPRPAHEVMPLLVNHA